MKTPAGGIDLSLPSFHITYLSYRYFISYFAFFAFFASTYTAGKISTISLFDTFYLSPVTSTKVGISPQNFLTFNFYSGIKFQGHT